MNSLLLSTDWDICLDNNGSLSLASNTYSIAQNVATAVRTFLGDVFFDTTMGIDHHNITLVKNPNLAVIRSRLKSTAESVSGVSSATVNLAGIVDGMLDGDIVLTLDNNEQVTLEL